MKRSAISKLKYLGEDVRIADTVIIKYPELVSIGNHVAIDDFCYISTALELGDYIHIAPFCSIIGGRRSKCILKDFVGLSAGCRIICGSDDYLGSGLTNPTIPAAYHADIHFSTIILEKHSLLGTNCVLHPGIILGEGAAVGSCSLVTKNLESWQIYVGVPVKVLKPRNKCHMLYLEKELREAGL